MRTKTKDELHQKVRLTPRVPRVVLKSNSQIGLQDERWMKEHLMTNQADQKCPGDQFTISLRNDYIQEFDSKSDGILSMTKIPPDDILEGLYKLRIRESEKLKTVLELYDLEIHQKKIGPDYHRLKTMVKRSIEQILRTKHF